MSPQCPTALCPGQLPSQLCATFGGGLRTPQVRLGLCWVLVFHTWCHLCPHCQEFLGLCICPSLGQEQEPGCSNAAQGSLLSAKGTTQSSTEAQLPRHQDSVLTCRNQSPIPWLCAVSTGLDMSSTLCARPPSCAPYCPGAAITGAQNPVPSSGGSVPT